MARDLKEADGWRFSSLRKMLLLEGLAVVLGDIGMEIEGIPSCFSGESSGANKSSLDPGFLGDVGVGSHGDCADILLDWGLQLHTLA